MEPSTNKIIDRILKDAREEAKIIVKEAKISAEKLVEDRTESARQSAERDVISLLKRAEDEAGIIRGKVATDIKRRASWIVLAEKERLVTSVLNEVKERLVNMQKSEEYISFLEKLIVDAGVVLGGGSLEVVLNGNDSSLSLKLGESENEITDITGVKTRLTISKKQT